MPQFERWKQSPIQDLEDWNNNNKSSSNLLPLLNDDSEEFINNHYIETMDNTPIVKIIPRPPTPPPAVIQKQCEFKQPDDAVIT